MVQENLHIRDYEERDLIDILAIENDSFPTPWSPGLFLSERSNPLSRILVVRLGERESVAGYAVFWRVVDEIHIHNLAVRRELRGGGIATRLLSYMIDTCRSSGANRMTLEVRQSNAAARKLYERAGFSVQGTRRGYYTDTGEDALIMWADLAGKG
jgi:ribosomal-protein-alanine N-acetyltransferase